MALTLASVCFGGMVLAQEKDTATSAVSTTSGDELYHTVNSNFTNTLVGTLPGLTVIQGNGELGNNGAKMLVRGMGSYGVGTWNTAKYFVDGFEVNAEFVQALSPAEIEEVQVLKDGAALTIYGERGANGVILIKTKRGVEGKANVTAKVRTAVQTPSIINKPLDSYEFASLYNQAVSNDNGMVWSPAYSDAQLAAYKNGTGVNVDWYDQTLKKVGVFTDADVIVNGGNKNALYNINLDFVNNGGLLNTKNTDATKNLNYNRLNLRANLDFNILKIFEVKVDLAGRIENLYRPNYSVSQLFSDLSRYPSNIYNIFDDNAKEHYSGTAIYRNNPYASVNGLGWYQMKTRGLQGNFKVKERLDMVTPGLYLAQSFSFYSYTVSTYSKSRNYARWNGGQTTTTDETTTLTASGYGSGGMQDWKQGKITAGYDGQWGKHKLGTALNFDLSAYKGDGYFSYKYNYVNFNGFLDYNFDDRYIVDLSFSYFGNDAYAKGNRWAFYPAASAAWVISNESFLKGSESVNLLKLRASAGLSGASDSGATAILSGYSSNGRFLFKDYLTYSYVGSFYTGRESGSWQSTLVPMFIVNENAHAEKSLKFNVGLDARLWNHLDFTVDAFLDKRSDILTLDNTIMGYYGKQYYFSNVGKMTNAGFEMSLAYSGQSGDFGYNVAGAVSYNHNIINNMSEIAPANPFSAKTGRPYGTYIGLVADGFYGVDDFDANGNLNSNLPSPSFGNVQPGDVKYVDLDKNGIVDQNDVTKIGRSAYPEWSFNLGAEFTYKGFDLRFAFQGVAGVSFNLLDNWNQTVAFVDNGNAFPIAKGAWAYYPTQGIDNRANATYPRLTTMSNENNYQTSSLWIKDASYLKLRNLELGYNFANGKVKAAGIENLRLFLSGNNLFTISPLQKEFNLDPESARGGYPTLRSYNIGVNITF